jgi:hypothetical protein
MCYSVSSLIIANYFLNLHIEGRILPTANITRNVECGDTNVMEREFSPSAFIFTS